ncbi:TolC family protein [Barnesiella sp. B2-R-119]|uniref:TolC family protein n=1 Tax=Barnesiella sp. B2-R-119 TaxID=2949656 RepID=UPI0020304404|nr:TolC family protein [Barnesiella sp. B2-R-119]MCM0687074.1 TolC family protein [Barnesiella sp. B2-R-119]
MKKVTSVFLCCFLFIALNYAQSGQAMTLKECIEMGIANNLSLQNKNLNVQKSKYGISENRFKLLPVINAFANFTNSPEPAVSVTDGSKYGTPYNVTKTLRYNANGGLQLQLPLYNQTLYTSIAISELVNRIDLLSYEKAKEDLIVEIGKLYFLGQTTICQLQIIEGNIARLDSLRNITQAFFDNGMAMDVDVKRVEINLENMRIQYHNAQAMLNQQLNLLKYTLDLPSEYEITLTPLNPDITGNVRFNGLSDSLYELQLLDTQTQLLKKQGRIINQGYIPSLNFTSQLAYSAYTDKFKHFFHSHISNKWYESFNFGLSLKIPIFDGLSKHTKKQQANVEYRKAVLQQENTRKQLETQYTNSVSDLMNNQRNYEKQQSNYKLAEEVYLVTTDKYKEGIASMTELLQDELRLTEAQNGYLSAHYNYKIAELNLLKLTQQLDILTQ